MLPDDPQLTATHPGLRGPGSHDQPRSQIAPDCRHYRGDRPCIKNRLCEGCTHYEPYSHRVCIVKLGALGDVIRTLCILPELRRVFPAAQITWVTKPNGCRMLANHPMIDRLLTFDAITAMRLGQESFDTLISLDKEPEPCALAMTLRAQRKLGVGLSEHGTPVPLNPEAHDYFHLGLSDDLKFKRNTKSYPQLIYEALGWTYQGQRYELPVDKTTRERVRLYLSGLGWRPTRPTLGINVGAGPVFANKMWPVANIVEFILQVRYRHPLAQIVLLGGHEERAVVNAITARLKAANATHNVFDSGTDHDEASFVALIDSCDVVFSGDTMAMHVAIARQKHVVVFFGPTCEQEIDLFGRGEKLVARSPCSPCYKRVCDHDNACVEAVGPHEAAAAIARALAAVPGAQATDTVRVPLKIAG